MVMELVTGWFLMDFYVTILKSIRNEKSNKWPKYLGTSSENQQKREFQYEIKNVLMLLYNGS